VSDKITVVEEFVDVADTVIIGGAMANTILATEGISVGASKVEDGQTETVQRILASVDQKVGRQKRDDFLVLPTDMAVAKSFSDEPRRNVALADIAPDDLALDVGDETIERIVSIL